MRAHARAQDDASDAGRLANIKEVPPGKSNVSFDLIVSKVRSPGWHVSCAALL